MGLREMLLGMRCVAEGEEKLLMDGLRDNIQQPWLWRKVGKSQEDWEQIKSLYALKSRRRRFVFKKGLCGWDGWMGGRFVSFFVQEGEQASGRDFYTQSFETRIDWLSLIKAGHF